MMMPIPVGFAAPWVLAGLLALPALWLLLRAVPPRPRPVVFPGTALLLGLRDAAPLARRMPWWLLALRIAAMTAAILALAGPVWRAGPQGGPGGPLLVVMDAGWTASPAWHEAAARAGAALDGARTGGGMAALWLADGQGGRGDGPVFGTSAQAGAQLRAAMPQPWETRYPADLDRFLSAAPAAFDTLWIADGVDHPGRGALLAALAARGRVTVAAPARMARALSLEPGARPALVMSAAAPVAAPAVLAIGPDPQGMPRPLARLTPGPLTAAPGGGFRAAVPIDLPAELRNRITRFVIEGEASAGAVVLADERTRRRKVALVGDLRATEGQALLSPLHYLRGALAPFADLVEGSLTEVLPAAPDVVIMVDSPAGASRPALTRWVEAGGMLIRFSGPRLAASPDLAADPLLPVRLRPGGRSAGGALSWGAARQIAPFAPDGLFSGLAIPAEVTVRAQLLPDPAPDLPGRTIAQLTDGTPLVTRSAMGKGQLVLFHSSANAEWSNLALSGLFVSMLERLVGSVDAGQGAGAAADGSGAARSQAQGAGAAAPQTGGADHWQAEQVLDGFGRVQAPGSLAPVTAAAFAAGPAPGAPAGIYAAGERRAALNAGGPLTPAAWPGATIESGQAQAGTALGGALLALAAALLALDAAGSALVGGTGRRLRAQA
ncbi:BatA domain-containing protein [Paracoccus contaminans]|uniref:BatA domain-containing protein n=1 Tax=Paracoccus contaminans TaxID=1945662 RepID=UPI0012F4C33F